MERADVVAILRAHEAELRRRGVLSLSLFGFTARGEARPDSDVDLLVDLAPSVGLFEFVDLKERLEALLGRPVDLVPRRGLKRRLKATVLAEAETVLVA